MEFIVSKIIFVFVFVVVVAAVVSLVMEMLGKANDLKEKYPGLEKWLERKSSFNRLLLVCIFLLFGVGYELVTKEGREVSVPADHTTVAWADPVATGLLAQPPMEPFTKDEEPRLNMGFRNAGNFSVLSHGQRGEFLLVPLQRDIDVFHEHYESVSKESPMTGGALVAHDPGNTYSYLTYSAPRLTDQDVYDLNHGIKMLCGVAFVNWTDETGQYRTDFEQCLMYQGDEGQNSFNWHVGKANNRETKLQ